MTSASVQAVAGVISAADGGCEFVGRREGRCLIRIAQSYVELPLSDGNLALAACMFPTDRASYLQYVSKSGGNDGEAARFFDEKWARLLAACSARSAPSPIRLQATLVPEPVVVALSRGLSWLFSPVGMGAFLALALWTVPRLDTPTSVAPANLYVFVALTLLGVLAHELGHATAAFHGGARPGRIGIGLYLIFPVAFSDVTHAWRLPRSERLIVNLGGLYLQGMFVLLANTLNLKWPYGDLTPFNVISGFLMLHALNPCFRTDGYWLLADATGVRSPHRRVGELLFGMVAMTRADVWLLLGFGAGTIVYVVYVATVMIARPILYLSSLDYSVPVASIIGQAFGPLLLVTLGTVVIVYLGRQALRSREAFHA